MMKIEQKSYGFRNCARCGLSFEARTWNQRYCSRECRERDYNEANAERIREKNRKYHQEHMEQFREYGRKYYRRHPEKCRKRNREYISSHPERMREYRRKYYQEHREVIRLQSCSNYYDKCANCPYDDCVREI